MPISSPRSVRKIIAKSLGHQGRRTSLTAGRQQFERVGLAWKVFRSSDVLAGFYWILTISGAPSISEKSRIDMSSRRERELACAKGEEYAVPLDFPVKWDIGAPLPHVLQNDNRTFLTFYVHEPDPNWHGTYVTLKDPGDGSVESLALVEFIGCHSAKLGTPNDEVLNGHPLYGKGLVSYTAQMVENSRWLAELEGINKVHPCYKPAHWRDAKHYVFWFHDTTFECVADSYKVELFRGSMAELLTSVCERLLSLHG
jgi:hypothetical protein